MRQLQRSHNNKLDENYYAVYYNKLDRNNHNYYDYNNHYNDYRSNYVSFSSISKLTVFRPISHGECYKFVHDDYSAFTAFYNEVDNRLTLALINDFNELSKKSDSVTEAAVRRATQINKWFHNVLDGWYQDVKTASESGKRKCLTEKFPDNSPFNLNKECVSKRMK